ncbi:MAG: NADH-quinone oxidoreductase subunit NuoH [Anaerolineae bacterium]|nr:NADH-quinone oxidoreductase subunit NuoH [Anaerolineae bacterium]
MQYLTDFIVSLNIPYINESAVKLIVYFIFAAAVAVAAPASLIVLTWLERKIIGRIQNRLGPNRAGPFGWFQAVADMIKMFTKEDITPASADRLPYNIAPGLAVISAIMVFAVIPFAPGFVGAELNVGVLYIVAVGAIGTLGVLVAGWASNNKYSLLGAYRSVAMILTYEIPMVITLLIVTLASQSMSLVKIIEAQSSMWYFISLPAVFLIFLMAGVAEVGRSPFDLIEGESELVAGFHTEYSGIKFGLFMIGEYVHMFALSFFLSVFFFGGWQIPFINVAALPFPWGALLGLISILVKVFFFVFVMMWLRGTLPRFRIDHLLDFGWKFLVPLALFLFIGVAVAIKVASGEFGKIVAMLAANLIILAIALMMAAGAARRSRNKGLRAVTAVDPIIEAR